MDPAVPPEGRDLYALDPGEFTAARNALVKELRAAGRRDEAAGVAKLRRPPVTAWALNRVARDRPDLLEAVLDAGRGLRAATEQALEGDASALRPAQAAERRAVDAVTATASSQLETTGKAGGDTARQRMAATLRAAVVDPTVAEPLLAGALDADHEAPGFGLESFPVPATGLRSAPPGPARTAGQEKVPAERPPRADGSGPRAESARRSHRAVADEAEHRARQLERSAAGAERRAAELRVAAGAAVAEAERTALRAQALTAELDEAEATAASERRAADRAAAQADEARARADS